MNRKIKRSKSLRTWHKYKKLVYLMLVVLVIIVAIIVGVMKAVGGGKKDEPSKQSQEASTQEITTPAVQLPSPTEPTTAEPETTVPPETEPPAPTDIVKTPSEEEFTSEDSFEGAIFIGDAFVEGIDLYQFLDSDQLVYDRNWTTGKASNAMSKVSATNANKVYLQIGINDLNNGKSAEKVYESYKELVDDIKKSLPNAEIYVISLFPVTSGFAARDNIAIDNDEVAKLNEQLAAMEGVTFLDVNKSIADSEGNLPDDMSTSGLNIKKGYYGFIMNLIAEMSQ